MKYCRAGHRHFCCDNITMLSDHKVVCNCHITILYFLWLPHLDIIFRFFFWSLTGPWGCINLSCCRCREAKKLSRAQLWYTVHVYCTLNSTLKSKFFVLQKELTLTGVRKPTDRVITAVIFTYSTLYNVGMKKSRLLFFTNFYYCTQHKCTNAFIIHNF